MSLGRRKVSLHDEASWVFNRMVEAYEQRPAYPDALIEHLAVLAGAPGARVGDIGAGLGHLALPLAARGFDVTAVEPAVGMLEQLRTRAARTNSSVRTVHAAAESMPIEEGHFDLVLAADVVHFLDSERAAHEVARVLGPRGALALITVELSPTPFMQEVVSIMEESAPRRPRQVRSSVEQLLSVCRVRDRQELVFEHRVGVSPRQLEGILCSISFIGPAMNAHRYAAFRERILAIEHERQWARTMRVYTGRRR